MADWAFPIGMEVEIVRLDYLWYYGEKRGVVVSVDSDPMRRNSTWMESRRVRFHESSDSPKWFALEALKAVNVVDALANLGMEVPR